MCICVCLCVLPIVLPVSGRLSEWDQQQAAVQWAGYGGSVTAGGLGSRQLSSASGPTGLVGDMSAFISTRLFIPTIAPSVLILLQLLSPHTRNI